MLGSIACFSHKFISVCFDRHLMQPLSDARNFGHEDVCKTLEAHGGYDPVCL